MNKLILIFLFFSSSITFSQWNVIPTMGDTIYLDPAKLQFKEVVFLKDVNWITKEYIIVTELKPFFEWSILMSKFGLEINFPYFRTYIMHYTGWLKYNIGDEFEFNKDVDYGKLW